MEWGLLSLSATKAWPPYDIAPQGPITFRHPGHAQGWPGSTAMFFIFRCTHGCCKYMGVANAYQKWREQTSCTQALFVSRVGTIVPRSR
eukprot:1148158-Pelagomonas_calceolata.AAC.1